MESLKVYWDMHAVIETARDDAFDEGKVEGKDEGERNKAIEVEKNLIKLGLNNETINTATSLSVEEVELLRKQ